MKGFEPLKALIVLLFVANIGFLAYNAISLTDRVSVDQESDGVEGTHASVASIKNRIFAYEADINRIKKNKIIKVKSAGKYFADQGQRRQLRTPQDIVIPITPDSQSGRKYEEEVWKIPFQSKQNQRYKLVDVAHFCELIETESPGFQIKEIDMGSRDGAWGRDSWKVNHVIVRRLTPKKKK